MSGFPIVDLVVGVIFFYFLLSIISSAILEIVLTIKRTRAKVLEEWLLQIFDEQIKNSKNQMVAFGSELLDHCTLTALSSKTGGTPSYIDAKNFVSALLERIANGSNPQDLKGFISALSKTTLISNELKNTFLLYANEANDTVSTLTVKITGAMELFRTKLENWYDSNMDRITGTMKAVYTGRFTLIIAIVATLLLNADTITTVKYLYSNDEARATVAARAYETGTDKKIQAQVDSLRSKTPPGDTEKIKSLDTLKNSLSQEIKTFNEAKAALKQSFPIGWNKTEFAAIKDFGDGLLFTLLKLIGLAVTVLAIMMGAPFWFDLLNKIANLRGTGPKPVSTTDGNFNNAT